MVSGTGSIPTSNPQFRRLRRRLLVSYLGAIVVVTGTSAIAVYQMVAHNLYQQVDNHLLTLAQTAAKSLALVKHEYREYEDDWEEDDEDRDATEKRQSAHPEYSRFLNIDTVSLPNDDRGVEWFDERGQLLIREGTLFPNWAFSANKSRYGKYFQQNGSRSLVFPVFLVTENQNRELAGYVRATESLQAIEQELERLRWGLSLGGVLALILAAIGGILLTNQALQPIEQSFEQLRQFTADASHELRSPLAAIKTSIFLLNRDRDRVSADNQTAIATIDSAAQQMKVLVEDLLLLARLDRHSNPQQLDGIEIPLDEILEDLLDEIESQAHQRQITINAKITANIYIRGHGVLLKRIFANLLENALQYTPKGGTIAITLKRVDRLAFASIQDTGIGITAAQLPHIFERFWRADKARDRREGGIGLGLAIAQSLAITHGGKITVTSQLGAGSCFLVRLPLALSSAVGLRNGR
jgi:OmpR-family two-component system manganese-sensing sensor histidine kinase